MRDFFFFFDFMIFYPQFGIRYVLYNVNRHLFSLSYSFPFVLIRLIQPPRVVPVLSIIQYILSTFAIRCLLSLLATLLVFCLCCV